MIVYELGPSFDCFPVSPLLPDTFIVVEPHDYTVKCK